MKYFNPCLVWTTITWWWSVVDALSSPVGIPNSDRFHATCPADLATIQSFDASIDSSNDGKGRDLWVAVFRSDSTPPSVFLRDELFQSMKEATSETKTTAGNNNMVDSLLAAPVAQTPIAIARLCKSNENGPWLLDNLRCSLEKEKQNEDCDGGSEFVEALGLCVDALLLEYLSSSEEKSESSSQKIQNQIRSKATLHSSRLLEARGFDEVQEFNMDLATHVSQYKLMLSKYQDRLKDKSLPISSVQRAKGIVDQLKALKHEDEPLEDDSIGGEGTEDEFDPWSGVKQFL